jgi:hypothetical protein
VVLTVCFLLGLTLTTVLGHHPVRRAFEAPHVTKPPPTTKAPPTTEAPPTTLPPPTTQPPPSAAIGRPAPTVTPAPPAPVGSVSQPPAGGTSLTVPGAAANRDVFWTNMSDLTSMSEAQLTQWHEEGIGGFVGETQWLPGMGGSGEMSGNPSAVSGSNYSLEESIEASNIVARAHALGMKVYLAFYLVNYFNTQTPLAEWFDNSAWENTVIPAVQDVAAGAHMLGFDGIAMDQELYGQSEIRGGPSGPAGNGCDLERLPRCGDRRL